MRKILAMVCVLVLAAGCTTSLGGFKGSAVESLNSAGLTNIEFEPVECVRPAAADVAATKPAMCLKGRYTSGKEVKNLDIDFARQGDNIRLKLRAGEIDAFKGQVETGETVREVVKMLRPHISGN